MSWVELRGTAFQGQLKLMNPIREHQCRPHERRPATRHDVSDFTQAQESDLSSCQARLVANLLFINTPLQSISSFLTLPFIVSFCPLLFLFLYFVCFFLLLALFDTFVHVHIVTMLAELWARSVIHACATQDSSC